MSVTTNLAEYHASQRNQYIGTSASLFGLTGAIMSISIWATPIPFALLYITSNALMIGSALSAAKAVRHHQLSIENTPGYEKPEPLSRRDPRRHYMLLLSPIGPLYLLHLATRKEE
jgi:hypothetical protein